MSDEGGTWAWFRGGVESYGHLTRIENMLEAGTPDVNYCLNGKEGWIELKYAPTLPKRETTSIVASHHPLLPAQIEWLVYRAKCKGRGHILLRCGLRVWLVPAHRAPEFNAASTAIMGAISVYHHQGPMQKQDWADLVRVLTTRRSDDDPNYD